LISNGQGGAGAALAVLDAADCIEFLSAENEHLKDVYSSATECFLEADAENKRLREALRMIANGEVPPSVWPDLAVRYEKFALAALGEKK
jgi:hypothetical protein